jgi:hypothetical protein
MTEPPLIDLETGMGMLTGARSRRLALREAIDRLEDALSAPSRQAGWADKVTRCVAQVRSAFDAHVAEVEAEGGMLADVLESHPRLAPVVAVLRDEHVAVDDALDQLAGELVDIGGDFGADQAATVRRRGVELIGAVVEHRQRGADLVFDAYSVDIGGW